MNKKERQGIADAFRACLPYLWNGIDVRFGNSSKFICYALERSYSPGRLMARKVVEKRLENWKVLSDWLRIQIGEDRYQAEANEQRMQAHRKAWVLQLIKEFEQ